jgi:mRNA interferase RelE/StbE
VSEAWQVSFSDVALKSLKKLDPPVAALLLGFVAKNLQGCANPREIGKPLSGDVSGKWRYRLGDYRFLCLLEDESQRIIVMQIAHRKEVYR